MKKELVCGVGLMVGFGLVLASCMKKPNMDPDYGPEVSLEKIQEALSSDTSMDPLKTMKLGQYVSIDEIQVIDTQIPIHLSQRLDEITHYKILARDSANQPIKIELAYKIVLKEHLADETWKESVVTSVPLLLDNSRSAQAAALSTSSVLSSVGPISEIIKKKSLPLSIQSLKAQDAASEVRITYHNLRRELGTIPIPAVVRGHPNCGGILRCDLPLRTIQIYFDRIVWDPPEHGNKTVFRITYSPDIPSYVHDWDSPDGRYLTNQLQACAQIFLEIQNQNGGQTQTVPILQCSEVRDFQF